MRRRPGDRKGRDERRLSASELDVLPFLDKIRTVVAHHRDLDPKSERVSYSDAFGYIFRYRLVDGGPAGTGPVRARLTLWSRDGDSLQLESGSTYRLPGTPRLAARRASGTKRRPA